MLSVYAMGREGGAGDEGRGGEVMYGKGSLLMLSVYAMGREGGAGGKGRGGEDRCEVRWQGKVG